MNTATQLLEQALEALIESRDDVATAIHLVPSYKADLERRVAEATEQLNKHESTIKEIEAYLAKQQAETLKPLGIVYRWTALKDGKVIYQYSDQGYPKLFKNSVVTLPTEPEQQVKQEPVAIVLNTGTKQGVKWLKDLEHGVHLYTSQH